MRADLDRAATFEYPVIGHFHNVEQSVQVGATDTDGMQVDIAMADVVPFGVRGEGPALEETGTASHPLFTWRGLSRLRGASVELSLYGGQARPCTRSLRAELRRR